jgi:hypothetical protein
MRALVELSNALKPRFNHLLAANKYLEFREQGTTGFGDRLRGISLLAFLASFYHTKKVLYEAHSSEAFPWNLTDLISIEGLEFISREQANLLPKLIEIEHNCAQGTIIKRFGYKYMRRLRPCSQYITQKLDSLGLGPAYIGIHIRTTDSAHGMPSLPNNDTSLTNASLQLIQNAINKYKYSHAYLACDSLEARNTWSTLIERHTDLKICWNPETKYDNSLLRQTSGNDMITDFFALSRCGYLVRSVPSEFSRFAALVGGLKMNYNQLHGRLNPRIKT